jgi:hypothetical protein
MSAREARFWSLGEMTVGVGEDGDVTVGDVEADIWVKMGSTAGIELHPDEAFGII